MGPQQVSGIKAAAQTAVASPRWQTGKRHQGEGQDRQRHPLQWDTKQVAGIKAAGQKQWHNRDGQKQEAGIKAAGQNGSGITARAKLAAASPQWASTAAEYKRCRPNG